MSSKQDEEDGLMDDTNTNSNDDDDEDEEEEDDEQEQPPPKKRKKLDRSMIDDAAEESGDENGDDDDEDDDDEDNNDYVKDGFVVDEGDDDEDVKKKKDDLEDSDDEEDDDDDDDDKDSVAETARKRLKKVRKMRTTDRLDEEDLALIQEAQQDKEEIPGQGGAEPAAERQRVMAKSEAELSRGLFSEDSGDEEQQLQKEQQEKKQEKQKKIERKLATKVERFDEDGMDDFIDDDIGDQGEILASDRRGAYDEDNNREVNQAQLNEASEIFGTDYLEFMATEQPDEEEEELLGKYREQGLEMGGESDDEVISDDDDDDDDGLFGDEDEEGIAGTGSHQKAEALRLKREKRKLAKAERRRLAIAKKAERRKAQIRRVFEPVQLVENFCTDRDDEIRQTDIPERLFDWKTPFHGSENEGMNEDERSEAMWIVGRVPDIMAEFHAASLDMDRENSILESIANALRFMHRDKLEPAFIKRYRKDYVTSPAVQANLYAVMDEDGEWDRVLGAREKVKNLLQSITSVAEGDASMGADVQNLRQMQESLAAAQEHLEDTAKQESLLKGELGALGDADDDDDDDDELFGDDEENSEEKKKERTRVESHLSTIQSLLQARADKVSQLQANLQVAEAQNQALSDMEALERVTRKMSREFLWNPLDYDSLLSKVTDIRNVLDVSGYLNLIKEGNDAIRKKEMPLLEAQGSKSEERKRSRRFDRDFYRTCVSEGLRSLCYRFLLAPNRVGIKLEDTLSAGGFDFSKTMPGEDNVAGSGDPLKWVAPVIPGSSPSAFASELVGSGELVLLSSTGEADSNTANDPLKGCRYVAAMELANEPRIRKHLRNIFRRHALLTTRPTKKGLASIDAFHDYYGLHLIRNKSAKEHFPLDENDIEARGAHLGAGERSEFLLESRKREKASCVQYLNILKAERTGDVSVFLHLPLLEQPDDWYKMDADLLMNRINQDLRPLLGELEKVYLPPDGDTDEWNEERRKVLSLALMTFLLPQFESELRRDLREAATQTGVQLAAEDLKAMAMEGPYRPSAMVHSENRFLVPTGDLPMVGVCCASDDKEATYLASVTERGESNDYLAMPAGTRIDHDKMREKVITFLLQSRPAAVLIGTSGGLQSRLFARKMGDVVTEAMQRWNTRDIQGEDEDDETFEARSAAFQQLQPPSHYDDDETEWKCNVELIDDSVSQLFGRSIRGDKEFPDFPVNLKCAIATARFAKDPLAELTYAWCVASDAGVFGTEMLYLNIHPLQQLLPKVLLIRQYERTLCEVVADVGTDINASCTFDHLRGLLMFVPGLGPRKATNLKQSVAQLGGAITKRRELLAKHLVGPVVYNNAVAFLRVREADQLVDQFLHPLDDTRLHPDVYLRNNWAIKIAFDALEREDGMSKEAANIKALSDVIFNSNKEVERLFNATKAEWVQHYGQTFNTKDWDPRLNVPSDMWRDKVEELDLEAFANMIQESELGRWHSHLEMIKWEFRLPFADPRKPMEPLAGDKLFRLITGESDQSLRPGREITGKVVRNGDFGSRIKLEGDVPAFIPLRNLADEHVESAEDIVPAGSVVTAIITEVKKDHMTVDMSLRMEDFRKDPSSWERPQSLPPLDDRFDRSAAARIEQESSKVREDRLEALQLSLGSKSGGDGEDGAVRKRRVGRVQKRACTHPAFRNAKNDEVDRELRDAGPAMVGEALIRPSSKSSDSLAVHWVVKEGSIKVIEIIEEEKETDASIGNKLKIKNETYGGIDELLGRYIAPMNDYIEELVIHRKFLDLPEDDVDEKLRQQKKASPASIPYAVCWMDMHPGYASLRFVSSSTPRSHPIGITPSGFTWGANTFGSLERLLNEFKKNPRGTPKAREPKFVAAPKTPQPQPPPPKPTATRWGPAAAAPPAPPAWSQPPPPPMPLAPPVAQGGWGAPSASAGGWGQAPQQRPLPPNLPPPPAYGQPPMQRSSPYGQPQMQRPPPPGPPPPFGQPPPPVATQQPAFDYGQSGTGQGRGRGRTLPAWMQKS